MAGIREVAKKAGVAVCTVSRVLNGTGKVAPETKERIEAAMKELDYVPNELARGMFRKKSGVIAMLVPNIQHPWFSSLAAEIEKELYKKGYKLMLCSTNDSVEREKEYFKILKSNIADGLICGTTRLKAEDYAGVNKPIIMLDYKVNDNIPLVVSDHAQGGELAAEAFSKAHCRYILHICSDYAPHEIMSYKSHEKLDDILNARGIQTRRVSINWNDFDYEGYVKLAGYILESYPDIDGLMAADLPAAAFLKAAEALGKRVPEDFCIIAYDGTYTIKTSTRDFTSIDQPYPEIGKKAVEVVTALVEGETLVQTEYIFPVSINVGKTTR